MQTISSQDRSSSDLTNSAVEQGNTGSWRPAAATLATPLGALAAIKWGVPLQEAANNMGGGSLPTLSSIVDAHPELPIFYSGMVAGTAVGAGLALAEKYGKKLASAAAPLGLVALGLWAMNKFGTEMSDIGSVEGVQQKAALAGTYAGARGLAASHPYQDGHHRGMSSSPSAVGMWYSTQLAKNKLKEIVKRKN